MATRVSQRIKTNREKQKLKKEQLQLAKSYCEERRDPDNFLEKPVSDYIGKGIFAAKDYRRGDFLLEYRGDLLSYSEAKEKEKEYGDEHGSFMYYFKYREVTTCIDATIDVFSMGRMVNDAAHNDPEENCEMNVIVVNRRPHLCLFATRDIPAGEELRYDYNVPNLPWRKTTIPTRETQAINTDFCPIGVFIQKTQSNDVHNCSEPANAQVLGDMKDAEKRIISTAISKESTQPENECETDKLTREPPTINTAFHMIGSSMEKTSMKTVQDFPESATIQMQTLVLGDRNDAGKGSISSSMSKESTRSERESEIDTLIRGPQASYSSYRIVGTSIERTPEKDVQNFPETTSLQKQGFAVNSMNDADNGVISFQASMENTQSESECEPQQDKNTETQKHYRPPELTESAKEQRQMTDTLIRGPQAGYSNYRIVGTSIERTPRKDVQSSPETAIFQRRGFAVNDMNDADYGIALFQASVENTQPESGCETTIPTRETQAINTDFCPIGVFIQKTQSNNVHNCSEPANAQVLGDMKDAEKRIISTAISKESTQPENECETDTLIRGPQAGYSNYRIVGTSIERTPRKDVQSSPETAIFQRRGFAVNDMNDADNGIALFQASVENTQPESGCEPQPHENTETHRQYRPLELTESAKEQKQVDVTKKKIYKFRPRKQNHIHGEDTFQPEDEDLISSGSEYSPESTESDSSDSSLSDVIPDISKFLKSPIPIQRTFQDNANTNTDTDRNPQVIYERVKTKDLANVNRKFYTQESQKDVNNKETDTGQKNGNSHREIQGYQPDVFGSLPQRKGGSSGKETQQNPDVIYQRSQDKELQFDQIENKQARESQSGTQEDTMDSNCFVPHTNNIECRKYDKKFVCLYCGKLRSKLPDHLIAKHEDEEDVISYMAEEDPREKNKKYIKIRNLGNHLHNIRVLTKRDGHLIVRYRPNGDNADPDMYGPCPFCFGYYIRRELWRHKCPLKPTQADKSRSKMAVTSLLLLPNDNLNSLLHKVVCTMKQDQISRVAKSDETILKLGEKLCNKHGHENDKYNYVRQKMRELARLLMELRKTLGLPNHSLAAFFHPKYYRFLVTCSKNVAGFDESTNRFGIPSLALKIGHSLQKCFKIVVASCIERRDKVKENEVEELQKLMDINWTDDMSSNALKTLQEEKRNRSDIIPLADDIKIFSDHLKAKASEYFKEIEDTQDTDVSVYVWTKLNSIVLAQLILFNRRRSGEVSRMKVSHYMAKQTADYGSQFDTILSGFEKKLCFMMPRIEIEGKRGRTVAVLFPQYTVHTIDLLLKTRGTIVKNENPYLFPAVHYGSASHIRGSDSLRKLAAECGATAPQRLRSTNLRKHIATMSQVLNLKENELDILANFMGHDIRVHREFYRLPEATVQVAKVAKLLLAMEHGGTSLPTGQSLDDIQLDGETIEEDDPSDDEYESSGSETPDDNSTLEDNQQVDLSMTLRNPSAGDKENETNEKIPSQKSWKLTSNERKRQSYTRRQWSDEEKEAVATFFERQRFTTERPGKKEFDACIKAHRVLNARTWLNVKDYFYNTFRRK